MKKLVTGTLFASALVIGMAFTTSCTVHTTTRVRPARRAMIVQPRPVVVAKPRRARQCRRNNVVVVRRR